jgi:hypothetical protein
LVLDSLKLDLLVTDAIKGILVGLTKIEGEKVIQVVDVQGSVQKRVLLGTWGLLVTHEQVDAVFADCRRWRHLLGFLDDTELSCGVGGWLLCWLLHGAELGLELSPFLCNLGKSLLGAL